MHSQATAYARLAESAALRSEPSSNEVIGQLTDESGLTVLPVSAQETGLLPNRKGDYHSVFITQETCGVARFTFPDFVIKYNMLFYMDVHAISNFFL